LDALLEHYLPIAFPVFFVTLWLVVTNVLALLAGWFPLAMQYPDRSETALLTLKRQSGSMGLGVGFNNILNLAACPTGLRVGMNRVFGPFSRPFFVPWDAIHVTRQNSWLGARARIEFGFPAVGRLTAPADVADRLARASNGRWPEPGPFELETPRQSLVAALRLWATMTVIAAAFFLLVPRLLANAASSWPPIAVAVGFPAVMFGIAAAFEYSRRRSS
jgi:hypothetical protein